MLTEDLIQDKNMDASNLIKSIATEIQGSGGGQAFFATAGGSDPSGLDNSLNKLKEILFNWLQFEMKSSICLDLFAGTGSIGIEAISRGSAKTIFVELNKRNYSQLSKILISLDLKEQTKVYFKDAKTWIKNNDLSDFDLIFLDPPFGENYELKILMDVLGGHGIVP